MKFEQLWQELINLTELHYRVAKWEAAQTDSTLRSITASYERVTIADERQEIKRIEQEIPDFGVIFLTERGVYGLIPKR